MVFVTDEFGSYNICDSAGEMDAPIAEFVAHAPVDIAWLLAELAKYHECEYERPVCEYNIKDELGYVEPAIHVLNAGGYPPRKVWHKEGE
jgi:hypothetical protein